MTRTLGKIEDGSATEIKILMDGKVVIFNLTLVAEKSMWDETKFNLKFAWTSTGLSHSLSLIGNEIYSGGTTGSGMYPRDITEIPDTITILTTDLAEIQKACHKYENDRADEHAEWLKRIIP